VMAAADLPCLPDAGDGGAVWVPREDLEREALSSLARKLVRHALAAAASPRRRRVAAVAAGRGT